MRNTQSWYFAWIVGATLIGCGGAEPAPEPTQVEEQPTTGGESMPAEEPEPIEEEAAAPVAPASGPAQLTIVTKVGSTVVAAHVKVLAADGSVVVEGESGTAFNVQSGSYKIEASITDAAIMVDTPTTRTDVEVAPGAELSETVAFPYARVKFTVNVNGKPDSKATVTLLRNGAVVATIPAAAPDFVAITPARYSGKVKSRNAEIEVSEIVISEDATRNIPLNVNL